MLKHTPVTYEPNFVTDPDTAFKRLREELDWQQRGNTPRLEYYWNRYPVPYTYGSGRGVRTYDPQPQHPVIADILSQLKARTGIDYDVCFLNLYPDQSNHLGWHADDSPEMDDSKAIAVVSLGVAREIWFREKLSLPLAEIPPTREVEKLTLGHGSLALMSAGMQDTHEHRIPKAGFLCGARISLTCRGYVVPDFSKSTTPKEAAGTFVLRKRDQHVLAIDISKKTGVADDWGLPCGKSEPGETLEQTAIRETVEETGVEVTLKGLLYRGLSRVFTVATFLATCDDDVVPVSSAEGPVKWVPWQKLVIGTHKGYNRKVIEGYNALQPAGDHLPLPPE